MTPPPGSDAAGSGFRVTPWERYMALDHGPRHSMTCVSRFWLTGPVSRQPFIDAVTAAARDSPFLAVRRRGCSWLPVAFDPGRQIDWHDATVPIDWRHLEPDDTLVHWTIRTGRLGELGLAERDRADEPGAVVVLRYPHSVADGLAAAALLRQVCTVLAGRAEPGPTRADLEARIGLGGPPAAARRRLRWQIGRIARYFRHWPAAYAPDGGETSVPARPPIACDRLVASAATTGRLRAACRAAGVTLNDLLLSALFRVLGPAMNPRDTIRIAVPTSLRPPGNAAFCNQVSMVFLDRVAGRVADPGLLRGVSAEMGHVKRWHLGHAMHWFLGHGFRLGDVPLGSFMRLPIVSTTAVLSNLGDPFGVPAAAAGPRVVAHDLLPPLRPGTNLAVAAVGHDGRLGLTARYAPGSVSADRARDVLEQTLAEAAALVGVAGDPGT